MTPPSTIAETPSLYLCDMTRQIMVDPLISKHGYTFERSFIMKWLAMGNNFCPISGKDMTSNDLVAAKCLREEIHCWRADNGLPSDKIVGMTLSVSGESTTVFEEDDFNSDADAAENVDVLATTSSKPSTPGPLKRLRGVFKVASRAA